jgi:hypothetical protein
MDIKNLIQQLCQPGARVGIGIWLMPRQYLGQEETIATRLNIQALDARQAYLEQLPEGARFSGLSRRDGHQKLTRLLHGLAAGVHRRDCLLVHTLDLLLLGLEVDERERFWRDALEGIPYPRAKLVLTVPEKASHLFPFEFVRHYAAQLAEGPLE